jgi:hypothetical protein
MLLFFALEWFGFSTLGLLLLFVFFWTNVCKNLKDEPIKISLCMLGLFMGGPFTLAGSILNLVMEKGWLPGYSKDTFVKSEDDAAES